MWLANIYCVSYQAKQSVDINSRNWLIVLNFRPYSTLRSGISVLPIRFYHKWQLLTQKYDYDRFTSRKLMTVLVLLFEISKLWYYTYHRRHHLERNYIRNVYIDLLLLPAITFCPEKNIEKSSSLVNTYNVLEMIWERVRGY